MNAGWWRDEGNYYVIVHHARYQRSREQVLKLQARSQQNGASGGRPPKPPREQFTPPDETHVETQMGCQVETQRDGTGQDRLLREGDQLTKSDNEKIGDRSDEVRDWYTDDDNSTAREFDDCLAAGVAYEPPTVDADGFPIADIR